MRFIFSETPVFTRQITDLLSDDEYKALQVELLNRPDAGAVIEGTGGCRKLRWATQGQGKRGGVRVIYYWMNARGHILMLLAYPKNVQDTLTDKQKQVLKVLVKKELGGNDGR